VPNHITISKRIEKLDQLAWAYYSIYCAWCKLYEFTEVLYGKLNGQLETAEW